MGARRSGGKTPKVPVGRVPRKFLDQAKKRPTGRDERVRRQREKIVRPYEGPERKLEPILTRKQYQKKVQKMFEENKRKFPGRSVTPAPYSMYVKNTKQKNADIKAGVERISRGRLEDEKRKLVPRKEQEKKGLGGTLRTALEKKGVFNQKSGPMKTIDKRRVRKGRDIDEPRPVNQEARQSEVTTQGRTVRPNNRAPVMGPTRTIGRRGRRRSPVRPEREVPIPNERPIKVDQTGRSYGPKNLSREERMFDRLFDRAEQRYGRSLERMDREREQRTNRQAERRMNRSEINVNRNTRRQERQMKREERGQSARNRNQERRMMSEERSREAASRRREQQMRRSENTRRPRRMPFRVF